MAFFVQYHLKEHVARTHTKEIPCTFVLTVASNCFSLLLSNPTTEHTQQRNPTSALTVESHSLAVN